MTRERSHWGWGWADRFPNAEARRQLAQGAKLLLGFGAGEPEEPVPLAEIALPSPRLDVPEAMSRYCTTETEDRIRHTYGRAFPDLLRGFRGDFASAPDAVAYPSDEEDIVALLRWATEQGAKVVPYGGGTSVVGGVEIPASAERPPVLCIDLREMNRLLAVDAVARVARIQAGATGPQLEEQLAEYDLTLRHFPQSFEHSTLGGWIATRAGGHFATLYTHIDELTAAVRMVTPTGVLETERFPASGAGPAPERWVLGSEGILGIITEAWMRVRPRPRHRAKANVLFEDLFGAVRAVHALSQSDLYPSNCRLLDKREALLHGVDQSGRHVLLLGFESDDHALQPWMERALAICDVHDGVCETGPKYSDPSGGGEATAGKDQVWKQAFFDAPYLQSTLLSMGLVADTFETCVPWDRFDALHAAVVRRVRGAMKKLSGNAFLSMRFTHVYPDGPAPYYTFVFPAERDREIEQWRAVKEAACDTLLEQGGTITHHHAVGRIHGPWYRKQASPVFQRALRAAKDELDPAGLLNPGVLIESS